MVFFRARDTGLAFGASALAPDEDRARLGVGIVKLERSKASGLSDAPLAAEIDPQVARGMAGSDSGGTRPASAHVRAILDHSRIRWTHGAARFLKQ